MEKILLSKLTEEEERIRVLKLRALKDITLRRFSPEVRKTIDTLFEELVCELLFELHMDLNLKVYDPKWFRRNRSPDSTLCYLTEELNILKVNQDIDCPKCFVVVKCLWLSKHLAVCMNPHQSTYSYSSRNSSRIARQRIQEGFKSVYDESRNESDDERVKSKRRNNKGRKTKHKGVRSSSK